jgi:peptidoglycan LD-endopeptidase LytH
MQKLPILLLLLAIVGFSCKSVSGGIFSKKTPHEKYADKVEDTPEGRAWLAASEKALEQPQDIQLPYSHRGYFQPGKPRALGLEFDAKHGERISFRLTKKVNAGSVIYADLFLQDGTSISHKLAPDTADTLFTLTINETGRYVLRLQPELNHSVDYSLAVTTGPSIGFPVAGTKARTGSFWGASRDGGKRSHEGIDIFAPKLTPVIAAEDGYISAVRDGGLGGKTVWQRVRDMNISLYYAHLDKQLVSDGDYVKKGDTIGLVGNTGNAKHTPAHLHFGVYGFGGAIDPWPFVNKASKAAPIIPSKELMGVLKPGKSFKMPDGKAAAANTLLVPLAVNAKGYIAELPDGNIIQTSFTAVKMEKQPGS